MPSFAHLYVVHIKIDTMHYGPIKDVSSKARSTVLSNEKSCNVTTNVDFRFSEIFLEKVIQ